jgi:D-sedoheptulose 7-phosphate isomerase
MNLDELKCCLSEIDESKLEEFQQIIYNYDNIIIIGNGGSNAIAQHIAQDYTKVLNKKALCFADASRLTCYINDYGADEAYVEFLKDFADKDTLVILISSSGQSKNIINCAKHCARHFIPFVLLSGFKQDNQLRMGDVESDDYDPYEPGYIRMYVPAKDVAKVEFWVNSEDYGVVELTHEAILHTVC